MGDTPSPTHRFYQLLALAYLACLSWMLLAPDPWVVFGEAGDRLAEQATGRLQTISNMPVPSSCWPSWHTWPCTYLIESGFTYGQACL